MTDPLDPARVRALTERLVAVPSVSPDPAGESACADAVRGALPAAVEPGSWVLPDGRRTVWALLRGRSPRTVLLLGHFDTVGVAEYAALGAPEGERIAFVPEALRGRLLERGRAHPNPRVRADLEEEAREPGTWLFGRGALDMKAGLAAGVAALGALAAARETLEGSVLMVACPDEENASAGITAALPELLRLRDRAGLQPIGALNLDFGGEPVAWSGVVGKTLVAVWVLGDPTHASDPFGGADATQLAAEIAARAARSGELADRAADTVGPPPVVLRLRDLKARYDAQTALEAVVELNLIGFSRPIAATLEAVRAAAVAALAELDRAMSPMRRGASAGADAAREPARVLTYPELLALAGRPPGEDPLPGANAGTLDAARQASLERVRRLAREASLAGPAVVIYALPPWYPPAAPGDGPLPRAARAVLERHGMELRPYYPHISDASYLAWRAEPPAALAPLLPALHREYRLPAEEARALDLDVVNLGPWGRDAHGLYERVNAPYAFGTLPGLIAEVVRRAVAG